MLPPEARSIPASELIRQDIVDQLRILREIYSSINYYKDINKYNPPQKARYKSEILSLYAHLRPKIIGYIIMISKKGETPISKSYRELVFFMDRICFQPSKFTVADMNEIYFALVQFCEDFGLTTLTYRQLSAEDLE
jgi:hypothetical protein